MSEAPLIRMNLASEVERAPAGRDDHVGPDRPASPQAGAAHLGGSLAALGLAALLLLVGTGGALVMPGWPLLQERATLRQALDARPSAVDPAAVARPVASQVAAQRDSLVVATARLSALEVAPDVWPELLLELAGVVPARVRLTALEPRSRDPVIVELHGVADAPGRVPELMAGLRQVAGLDEIALISSAGRRRESGPGGGVVHDFRLEVRHR